MSKFKMRQYLFGVLIVSIFQWQFVFCQNLNDNNLNRGSSYVDEITDGEINGEITSSESLSMEENEYNIKDNEKEDKYADFISEEDVPGDYDSDIYQDDAVAYWESIYGKEDVPDFEVPPPIDGHTIFMDLGDFEDSWDDQDPELPIIPVKRDANVAQHWVWTPSSVPRQRSNLKNPPRSSNSDYRSVMTSSKFHGSGRSSKTESSSNLESSWSSNGIKKSEDPNIRIAHIDGEMEIESQYPSGYSEHPIESASMKLSGVSDSLLNTKRKIIEAKKDLIKVAASGGSKAEVSDAVHRTIEAKKDFIDSVVSGKTQRRNEFVHSVDHSNRGYYKNDKTPGYADPQGYTPQSVLDSKKKVIQAKKDLIYVSAVGTKAELSEAVIKTLGAKRDHIDSILSSKAAIIRDNKGLGHSNYHGSHHTSEKSYSSSSCNRKVSTSRQKTNYFESSRSPITANAHSSGSVNNEEHNIQESKTASSHSETIQNEKSSSQSSGSASSDIHVGGKISSSSSSSDENPRKESSLYLKNDVQSSDRFSSRLESGSIETDSQIYATVNSDRIIHTDDKKKMEVVENSQANLATPKIDPRTEFEVGKAVYADLEVDAESEISESDTKGESGTVVEKTSLETGRDYAEGKNTEIVETGEKEENSKSMDEVCASGQCGVSGKLHVNEDSKVEDYFESFVELDYPEHHRESDEQIFLEDDSREDVIGGAIENKETEDQPELNFNVDNSDAEKDEMITEDVVEKTPTFVTDLNTEYKNDDGAMLKYSLNESGKLEGGAHGTELVAETVADEQLEGNEDSFATEKSMAYSILAGKGTFQKNEEEDSDAVVDSNSGGQSAVEINNLKNESQSDYEYSRILSTYEKEFGKHYSSATQHHRVSQNTEKINHFRCFDGSSSSSYADVEQFGDDRSHPDGHCRLINLDVNCSGMTAFMRPECQQLNTHLWHPQVSDRPITLWTVKTYLSQGHELAIEMQNRARWLCHQGIVPKIHTPAMLHLINNWASENTVGINQESEFSLFGTKLLQRKFCSDADVTPNTFLEFLHHHSFRVIGTGLCHVRPKRCPINQRYRSFDGSCNNQNHPNWGKSNTAFARILPAQYSDGIHEPTKSVTGNELPNPRVLSTNCFARKSISSKKFTLALQQWGQLMSHDFALQTIDRSVEGGVECCADGGGQLPKNLQHHSCMPIDIPADDKFYSKFNQRCINFVRSMTISREDCTLGPADQLNTVTSYLDLSPAYGSSKETCDQLRSFRGGRMRVAVRQGRELLPKMTNGSAFCDARSKDETCYFAGDIRVNQNPQLVVMQTIFVRRHNRIANELASLNPHWDDEEVFQVAREIVIAEYQHITYREWLPLVIGKKYGHKYGLTLRSGEKMSQDYDPRIRASTINSFTTAAFRLFHTMVEGNINLCPANREISKTLRLSNHYFRPQIIEKSNNLDDLIRGLVTQSMQQSDKNFHPEITDFLFRSRKEFGSDLAAIDINRGRDHGLPCYNAFRQTCGLRSARDFDDLIDEILREDIDKLKELYADVNDIDLFVGIVMEKKSPGAIIGPVGRCLLGEQFYRSKNGDRYFYSHADQPHSFTQEQFEEIKKASLAQLLCESGDNIREIQPQAFKAISDKNPLTCCDYLPKIDLSPWRE